MTPRPIVTLPDSAKERLLDAIEKLEAPVELFEAILCGTEKLVEEAYGKGLFGQGEMPLDERQSLAEDLRWDLQAKIEDWFTELPRLRCVECGEERVIPPNYKQAVVCGMCGADNFEGVDRE